VPAADIGWRDFLTDPRLQRLVEIALANNRDLRVAALNVAQTRAQYRIQRAGSSAGGRLRRLVRHARTVATHSGSGNTVAHDYTVGLSRAWELDFFGRVQSLSDAALQQYFATAEARKAFEILLVSQVADQYLTMLTFDELQAVTRHTLEAAQASFQLTQLQFQAGTAPSCRCARPKRWSSMRRPTSPRRCVAGRRPRTASCCSSASRCRRTFRRRLR
jgi:multidrug efflux system outer membrane protein